MKNIETELEDIKLNFFFFFYLPAGPTPFFPLVSLYGNKQTVATDKKGEKLFY